MVVPGLVALVTVPEGAAAIIPEAGLPKSGRVTKLWGKAGITRAQNRSFMFGTDYDIRLYSL